MNEFNSAIVLSALAESLLVVDSPNGAYIIFSGLPLSYNIGILMIIATLSGTYTIHTLDAELSTCWADIDLPRAYTDSLINGLHSPTTLAASVIRKYIESLPKEYTEPEFKIHTTGSKIAAGMVLRMIRSIENEFRDILERTSAPAG